MEVALVQPETMAVNGECRQPDRCPALGAEVDGPVEVG